jgi:multidrug efflux pump subunit AcrA (membrane-fusion protein)
MLSLPGELNPYEMVAIYPRVTGFVKTVSVDRGSRVRVGDVLAVLDAPELSAQRAEAQSKVQAAAQLAATRRRLTPTEHIRQAESAVRRRRGNDVRRAESPRSSQIAAAEQNTEALKEQPTDLRVIERSRR